MVDNIVFVDRIKREAKQTQQRTGQYLFNILPNEAAEVVRTSLFDPFHKDLTYNEILEWIENHLIFKGEEIIGVFNGDKILWQAE